MHGRKNIKLHYTELVAGEWITMEQWWNDTDRGKPKYCAGEKKFSERLRLQPIKHLLTCNRTRVSVVNGKFLSINMVTAIFFLFLLPDCVHCKFVCPLFDKCPRLILVCEFTHTKYFHKYYNSVEIIFFSVNERSDNKFFSFASAGTPNSCSGNVKKKNFHSWIKQGQSKISFVIKIDLNRPANNELRAICNLCDQQH